MFMSMTWRETNTMNSTTQEFGFDVGNAMSPNNDEIVTFVAPIYS